MEDQIKELKDFEQTQLKARKALKEKNWVDLEKALLTLESKTEVLANLETHRAEAWKKVQSVGFHEGDSFYQILPDLPHQWREKISFLHRELKILCLRLQGLTQGIAAYVQTANSLVQSMLTQVHPYGNKLYDKNGLLKSLKSPSLILNTHL